MLNARQGVRQKTINRVQAAISELGYVRDTAAANLARNKTYRFLFVLPDWKGQFFTELTRSIAEAAESARQDRTEVDTLLVPNHDHTFLAQRLGALTPEDTDGVAIMADETPVVRDAISSLRARGVPVVSLVTDQPNSGRDHFVGIDNVAAGRTAGMLMGRFLGGRAGQVIVAVSSRRSRDMLERRFGFDEILREHFPQVVTLPSIEGREDPAHTEAVISRALAANDRVVGVYSAGASVSGVAAAVMKHQAAERLVFIDHELTDASARYLRLGVLDAVITQNTGHLARSALRVLRARCDSTPVIRSQENIRIDIVIKENLPTLEPAGSTEDIS